MSRASGAKRGNRNIRTNPLPYCLHVGFFAGVIWGLVRWLSVAMKFTGVSQAFLVDPWVKRSALNGVYWQIAGFVLFIAMSVIAALLYYALFKPYRGPLPGIVFGLGWWAIVYLAVGPVMGAVPPIRKIGWNSLITDMCLFLLWGLFIGFSIAYEYHDESSREPEPAGA